MRYATVVMLSVVLCGCAARNYYACRDNGGTREFCGGYPDAPRGALLPSQGMETAAEKGAQTASLGPQTH